MIAYGFSEYGGPETEYVLDIPIADPGQGQVLVAVHAAGVNPADWKVRSGNRKDSFPTPLPAVLGREVSGTVVQIGTHVDGFSVGDHVFGAVATGFGGYAQYTVLNAQSTAKKPDGVSFVAAATLPVAGGTAFDALRQLGLAAGNTLVVIGAGGGVGTAAVQLARADGISVIGIASAAKRDIVESLGAVWVESGEGAPDAVSAAAPGGVAAIFDLVGGDALRSVATSNSPGRVVSVADPVTAAEFGGSGVERDRSAAAFTLVAELVENGTLAPKIDRVFPLERAGEALALVESGHATGKVVLEVT